MSASSSSVAFFAQREAIVLTCIHVCCYEITSAVYIISNQPQFQPMALATQHNQHTCVPYTHIYTQPPSPPPRKVTPSSIPGLDAKFDTLSITTSKIPLRDYPKLSVVLIQVILKNSFQHLETGNLYLVDITS